MHISLGSPLKAGQSTSSQAQRCEILLLSATVRTIIGHESASDWFYILDRLLLEPVLEDTELSLRQMNLSRKKERKKKRSPVEIIGFLAIAAFVVGIVWLMFFTSPQSSGQTTTSAAHSLAADFVLTDVDGTTFRLSDYRGKVVVLEFMRTTCGACVTQEPRMRELRSRFGGDVVTVMISVDPTGDTEEILRQHRDQNLPGWIAIRDTSGVTGKYNIEATPTILIIDTNGYIAYEHVGVTESSVLIGEVSSVA